MIRTRKKRKKEGGKNDSVPVLFTRYVSLNVMGMIGLSCYILQRHWGRRGLHP